MSVSSRVAPLVVVLLSSWASTVRPFVVVVRPRASVVVVGVASAPDGVARLPTKAHHKRLRERDRARRRRGRSLDRVDHRSRRVRDAADALARAADDDVASAAASLPARVRVDAVRLLGARRAFDPMLRAVAAGPPCVRSVAAAVAALARGGDRRRALDVYSSETRVAPNTFVVTAALTAAEGPEEVDAVLAAAPDVVRDVHVARAAVAACARAPDGALDAARSFAADHADDERVVAELARCAARSVAANDATEERRRAAVDGVRRDVSGLLERGVVPSSRAWGAALSACAAAGAAAEAEALFARMDPRSRNALHCNQYLSALLKGRDGTAAERAAKALAVLEELTSNESPASPDVVTLNTVLACLAKSDDYDGARELLERAKRGEFATRRYHRGYHYANNGGVDVLLPDTISYNTVLSACRDSKEAAALVQEMRLSRRHRHDPSSSSRHRVVAPTQVTYTNALSACRRARDLETATRLVETAVANDGLVPNARVCSAWAWTAAAVGDGAAAEAVLDRVVARGGEPVAAVVDAAIAAYADDGAAATRLFERAVDGSGHVATAATARRLAAAIATEPSEERRGALLARSERRLVGDARRSRVGGPVLTAYVLWLGRAGKLDEARRVHASIVGTPDARAVSAMLYACSTASAWEEAVGLLRTHGRTDAGAYDYAVIACANADQWEEALALIEEYYDHDTTNNHTAAAPLSVRSLNAVVASCGRNGRPDAAVTLLNNMTTSYGVAPNQRSYRSVVFACRDAERERRRLPRDDDDDDDDEDRFEWWECALSMLRRMREDGLEPDAETHAAAVRCCREAGQWQRAVGLLREASRRVDDDDDDDGRRRRDAALAACGAGGAWVEALELWHRRRPSSTTPAAVGALLAALDAAGQREIADDVLRAAVDDGTLTPWRYGHDGAGVPTRVLDLHGFTAPMARTATRHVAESLARGAPAHDPRARGDLVVVVGQGDRRAGEAVLRSAVTEVLEREYPPLKATVEPSNPGRIRVTAESMIEFADARAWRGRPDDDDDDDGMIMATT